MKRIIPILLAAGTMAMAAIPAWASGVPVTVPACSGGFSDGEECTFTDTQGVGEITNFNFNGPGFVYIQDISGANDVLTLAATLDGNTTTYLVTTPGGVDLAASGTYAIALTLDKDPPSFDVFFDLNQDNGIGPLFAPTPIPAALPLFATGLGAMGFFGWRSRRKNAASVAA